MGMKAQKLFDVAATLDMAGITDEDLQQSFENRPSLLRAPGTYNFTITEVKKLDGRVDAANKKWGNLFVTATEDKSGNIQRFFVEYPIETVVYTGTSGKTSNVKTKIFASFIGSIRGETLTTADIGAAVRDVEQIVVQGATFRASVKYTKDHIERKGEGEFIIRMGDGSEAVDGSGNRLTFAEYENAKEYYKKATGKDIPSGMTVTSFIVKPALVQK